jgi:hypothetical protein
MKKISFVVIVLLFLAVTAAAQRVSDPASVTVTTRPVPETNTLPDISKASLGETTADLKEKIIKYGGVKRTDRDVIGTYTYEDVEFEDCTMQYTELLEVTRESVKVGRYARKYSFSFADIDSDKTYIGHGSNGTFNVTLHTHNRENKINEDFSFWNPTRSSHQNNLTPFAPVIFTDIDLVRRVGQAFRHVATLCNARKAN